MISTKNGQRAAALATAALAVAAITPVAAIPDAAYAADETRTFTWADGESQPSVPQTIQVNGQTYQLKGTSSPVQARSGGATVSQQFTRTVDSTLSPDQGSNIAGNVPSSVHVDDNGFTGDIPRTGIDYTPIYRTDVQHYDETRSYTVTERNESAVPQTITANGHNYVLASVSFADGQKDSQGNVLTYIATATYGTDVSSQVLDHYNVNAHYAGTLTKSAQAGSWTMTATYSSPEQNDNTNENEAAGVTSSFSDTGSFGAPENLNANEEVNENSSNPFENGNKTANSTNSADNKNSYDGKAGSSSNGIPVITIAAGVGVVAVIGIIAAIALKKRKKNNAENSNSYTPTGAIVDQSTAAGAAAVAGAGVVDGVSAAADDEDDFVPQAQLIELVPRVNEGTGETEAEQEPKANLTVDLSNDESIPTIIYFPPVIDDAGNTHELAASDEDSQFWIAVDEETVERAESDQVIVSTDDGYELYRGDIDTQFPLVRDETIAIVNGTAADLDDKDIQNELDEYDKKRAEIDEQNRQAKLAAMQEQNGADQDQDQEVPDELTDETYSDVSNTPENDQEGIEQGTTGAPVGSDDDDEYETVDVPFMSDDAEQDADEDDDKIDDDGFGDVVGDDEYDYEPVEVDEAESLQANDDDMFDTLDDSEFDDAATTQFDALDDDDENSKKKSKTNDDFQDLLDSIK